MSPGDLGQPSPSAPRFDTQPFEADGGFQPMGLIVAFVAAVVAGVAMGWLASLISQWFYLILIFPAVIGGAVGFAGALAVQFGKVRNPWLAGLAGAVGGVTATVAMHYFDYGKFVSILQEKEPAALRVWEQSGRGFVDFVDLSATQGVQIGRAGRGGGKGLNLGYVGSYIYWGVELLIVAGIAFAIMIGASREPYCTRCNTWKESRPLGRLAMPQADALAAFASGQLTQLATQSFADPGGNLQVKVAVCPSCREASSVDVKLETITKDEKGNDKTSEVAHVTYPGHALQVLEALATPRPGPA